MSEIRNDYKYTKNHEWLKVEGDVALVGISDHAQHALGDIVFVKTGRGQYGHFGQARGDQSGPLWFMDYQDSQFQSG
jgi:hypothetical protein